MKKLVLLLSIVVFSLVANAAGQIITKKDLINRAKAIAAFHVIHNKGGEFKNDNKEATNANSVDALEKLIKTDPDKKFNKICDDIEDYTVDARDTTSLIKSFKSLLEKYGVKDPGALEQIKTPIKNSSRLFNDKTETTPNDNDNDDDDDAESESQSSSVSSTPSKGDNSFGTVNKEESSIEENHKHETSEGFSLILPLVVLIIALLISLFMCYQLWKKQKMVEEENKAVVKDLSQIANAAYAHKTLPQLAHAALVAYSNLDNKMQKIAQEKKDLEKEIDDLKDQFSRGKSEYHNPYSINRESGFNGMKSYETKDDESISPTVTWDIQREKNEKPIREQEVIVEKTTSLVGKEMFLYLPNDGMFKEGSEDYRSGKTLYKMVYTSEDTAVFEFVNRPEALAFAKQSRSRFLEGACFIENDDAISFNTIQTLEKGKLSKVDEGWNIISKARIRLS